jgi:hypothetical protein
MNAERASHRKALWHAGISTSLLEGTSSLTGQTCPNGSFLR